MRALLFCLWLSLFLSLPRVYAQAQRVTRYKSPDGHLYTQPQVDSLLTLFSQRAQAQGMGAYLDIEAKQLRHDTLFCYFSIGRASSAMMEARAQRLRFVNQPLPAFTLRDLNGQVVQSTSLRGQPLVLNLWLVACTGCIEEMPALNTVAADPANQHIQFLSLTYETPTAVKTFLRKRPFHFRHLPAAKAYCDVFTQAYPLTILVDKHGIVRAVQGPLAFLGPQAYNTQSVPNASGTGYLDARPLYRALDEIR
jgi:peroxiredoxin